MKTHISPTKRHALFGAAIVAAATLGCGGSAGNRQAIEGTVTFDGQPLPDGQIVFVPQPGTRGPTAGSKIEDGRYAVSADEGTFVGTFQVEITAVRKTGRKIATSWGEMMDETANYIPARYNRHSELTAQVGSDGSNRLDFSLQSN